VLLTGATGYVGALVLEKLLRSTSVGRVYVLLRPRRGRIPAERLAQLLRTPLFHQLRPQGTSAAAAAPVDAGGGRPPLRTLNAGVLQRVAAIEGDITSENLGLSDSDRALLISKVDTVVHCAAGRCWL